MSLLTLLFLSCFFVPSLSITLKLLDDNGYGSGFYQVLINDELWLESGSLDAFLNNRWYTTNTSAKSSVSSSSSSVTYSQLKLLSVTTSSNLNDAFGGSYDSTDYEWVTNDAYATVFHTIFKVYNDGKALSFMQYFPNGATGTNFLNESDIPSNCEDDFNPNPTTSTNSLYAQKGLGWLTWAHTFSTARYGKGALTTEELGGVNGGPVVLYNQVESQTLFCFYFSIVECFASDLESE